MDEYDAQFVNDMVISLNEQIARLTEAVATVGLLLANTYAPQHGGDYTRAYQEPEIARRLWALAKGEDVVEGSK